MLSLNLRKYCLLHLSGGEVVAALRINDDKLGSHTMYLLWSSMANQVPAGLHVLVSKWQFSVF